MQVLIFFQFFEKQMEFGNGCVEKHELFCFWFWWFFLYLSFVSVTFLEVAEMER